MTSVLTGRLILESLYTNGEQTTVAALATALNVEPAALEKLLQSLSAAKLVIRTDDSLALTDGGRSWCASKIKQSPSGEAAPLDSARPALAIDQGRPDPIPMSLSRATMPTVLKSSRIQGVDVVHLKRRKVRSAVLDKPAEPTASSVFSSAPVASSAAPVAPAPVAPAPVVAAAAATPAPTTQTRRKREPAKEAKAPASETVTLQPGKAESPRVVVNSDGFVTHINGTRIY
ncbi:hypothetical protein [Telmatospirillum sp.]|uniref:hypothetical protein n=1 Tax=Telmatospirillum sp. TaxID=2079197 RepID=UPI00284AEEBC|nr:hypothetical protein [Telmatospirillum sp.]MDR3439789.1 hypothetical protein [Telmatospirillum sp.]